MGKCPGARCTPARGPLTYIAVGAAEVGGLEEVMCGGEEVAEGGVFWAIGGV